MTEPAQGAGTAGFGGVRGESGGTPAVDGGIKAGGRPDLQLLSASQVALRRVRLGEQATEQAAERQAGSAAAADGSGPVGVGERAQLDGAAVAAVMANVDASMAANTRAAYARDWARFASWAGAGGHVGLPADPWLVASYLTEHAALRKTGGKPAYTPATLTRWSSSINQVHGAAGHAAPGKTEVVRRALAGIRSVRATPPVRRAPLLLDDIRQVLSTARDRAVHGDYTAKVRERRDSLMLLLGFAGALRRSELVALDLSDLALHRKDGLHVRIRTSKTDQQAHGTIRAAPYGRHHQTCVPCAWLRWQLVLDAADHPGQLNPRAAVIRALRHHQAPFDDHICGRTRAGEQAPGATTGPAPAAVTVDDGQAEELGEAVERVRPLFRVITQAGEVTGTRLGAHAVAYTVKARGRRAGLPAATVALLGGHSLRAGFVTQGFRSGADAHAIMRQTGHRSPAMLEVYAREDAPLVGNAVTKIGL